jgi:CrcB protein
VRRVLIVFVGGGLGSCTRALLLQGFASWNSMLPLPVLAVNILGAFVLSVIYILADEVELLRAETRLFLAVGLLGGFTTFSTFGWGADLLVARGDTTGAMVDVTASVVGGVLAVVVGLFAGRELVQGLERVARGILARLGNGRPRPPGAREDMAAIETEDREESA